MRIGFVSQADPRSTDSLSGIPYAMRQALARRAQVSAYTPQPLVKLVKRTISRLGLGALTTRLREFAGTGSAGAPVGTSATGVEDLYQSAAAEARAVQTELEGASPDVVFSCYSSSLVAGLDIDVPIVYYTDATPRTLSTYPEWAERPEAERRCAEEFEARAMQRSAAVVLASQHAASSAINDYGVPPERVHVVPLGCNVVPPNGQLPARGRPTRDHLALCLVGLNPVRKGLDLAIDVAEILCRRGIRTRLTYVGRSTSRARSSEVVTCAGRLRLGRARDRLMHHEILRQSHFMIMASVAEAFGIAPAEAALFGTPSIVRGVGGLPEVVLDGETGVVMPPEAMAEQYADELASWIDRPKEYDALCERAQRRAERDLTWSAWADRILAILEQTKVGSGSSGGSGVREAGQVD